MRLIDANALKKKIEEVQYTQEFCIEHQIDFSISMQMLGMVIDNAPTVNLEKTSFMKGYNYGCDDGKRFYERPQGKWVPVSERLPEKMGTYLVTLEYKEHGKGITTLWYHGKGIGWDLRVADVVTAWQSLPEPYKEGGTEE